jgi:hypothetical protein
LHTWHACVFYNTTNSWLFSFTFQAEDDSLRLLALYITNV